MISFAASPVTRLRPWVSVSGILTKNCLRLPRSNDSKLINSLRDFLKFIQISARESIITACQECLSLRDDLKPTECVNDKKCSVRPTDLVDLETD